MNKKRHRIEPITLKTHTKEVRKRHLYCHNKFSTIYYGIYLEETIIVTNINSSSHFTAAYHFITGSSC